MRNSECEKNLFRIDHLFSVRFQTALESTSFEDSFWGGGDGEREHVPIPLRGLVIIMGRQTATVKTNEEGTTEKEEGLLHQSASPLQNS